MYPKRISKKINPNSTEIQLSEQKLTLDKNNQFHYPGLFDNVYQACLTIAAVSNTHGLGGHLLTISNLTLHNN